MKTMAGARCRRVQRLCWVVFVFVVVLFSIFSVRAWNDYTATNNHKRRIKRDADASDGDSNKTCTPRAIDNFLGNFMTLEETQNGGVFIHIILILYLFGALAVVCDDYFVSSLERICEDLGLQEDVAGATFMAAGSSAPELFTSVIGVFFAKSDIGTGTIVGSAVFNILIIIGLSGLLTNTVMQLTKWPIIRDTVYYLLSVMMLAVVIKDNKVYWYEALIMFLMYVIYIIIMYFNRSLETVADGILDTMTKWRRRGKFEIEEKQPLTADIEQSSLYTDSEAETALLGSVKYENVNKTGNSNKEPEVKSPWTIPESFLLRVFWVAMVPIKALLYVTVPDCRLHKLRKLYMVTFIMSVVWIAVFSYLLVWMVTIAGDALEIPDTVMGLTLLAAGTSVPDCISSVIVARNGYGDMAVSNSIGSNVFDILMCLGLPWLLYNMVFTSREYLEIMSSGLLYSSLTLLSTVTFLFLVFIVNDWKLSKTVGVVFLFIYLVVIGLSCLYELNIFGDFNPPSCPSVGICVHSVLNEAKSPQCQSQG